MKYHKLLGELVDEIVFIDCYHELVRILHYLYPNQFLSCFLKKYSDVIFNSNKLNSQIGFSLKEPSPNSSKEISIVCVWLNLPINDYKEFNVTFLPPQLVCVDNIYLVCASFGLHAFPLFIDNRTKIQSQPTQDFANSIAALLNTKLFIDVDLLKTADDLIKIEFNEVILLLNKLIQDLRLEADVSEQTLDLELFMKNIHFKQKFLNSKLVKFKHNKIEFFAQKDDLKISLLEQSGDQHTIDTKLKILDEVYRDIHFFIQLWAKYKKKYTETTQYVKQLQGVFSKINTMKLFFSYKKFILSNNITGLHYFIQSDFRGRLYYKSRVSPQTI